MADPDPSYKGGGGGGGGGGGRAGHPDPKIRGGDPVSKKNFFGPPGLILF